MLSLSKNSKHCPWPARFFHCTCAQNHYYWYCDQDDNTCGGKHTQSPQNTSNDIIIISQLTYNSSLFNILTHKKSPFGDYCSRSSYFELTTIRMIEIQVNSTVIQMIIIQRSDMNRGLHPRIPASIAGSFCTPECTCGPISVAREIALYKRDELTTDMTTRD